MTLEEMQRTTGRMALEVTALNKQIEASRLEFEAAALMGDGPGQNTQRLRIETLTSLRLDREAAIQAIYRKYYGRY